MEDSQSTYTGKQEVTAITSHNETKAALPPTPIQV